MPEPDAPRELRRHPRPAVVHFLVDSAVCFLAILLVGLFLGLSWGVLIVAGLGLGAAATPLTRRTEARQLAARNEADPQAPNGVA
jgi:hypothetical protein